MVGKVGRKALRIYHEEGLLVPAFINEENGYHYYEESQLALLEKIRRLRKIGLSLYEIKQVLEGNASEEELIGSKIRELDSKLQEIKELTDTPDNTINKEATYEPDIRPFDGCTCIYIDENVELENLGMSVGKLYEKASKEGLTVTGDHFVIYECISSDSILMRTCLPVKESTAADTVNISEDKCLHLTFKDGFSKVARAHTILKEYADSHGITLGDRAYEVYKKDMTVDVYYKVTE